ncbi:UNVERIFIED_ORG: hypothetical protein QFZ59_002513 [Bacillus sp. B2I3]|nr:hypothetical protein [Bacillus sp. B2I3]
MVCMEVDKISYLKSLLAFGMKDTFYTRKITSII